MSVVRWTFYDPGLNETVTFEINPNDGGELQYKKNVGYQTTTAPDGRALIFEGQDNPQEMQWTGVVLTQSMRDTFVTWFNKRNQIFVTNDLGESHWIYIDAFSPTRKRVISQPYKAEYTMHAYILDITS